MTAVREVKPAHRVAITVASAVIGLGSIAAALAYVNRDQSPPAAGAPNTVISRETLAQNDGQGGNKCYVAVDGTVYEIENSALWVEGQHVTSSGRAGCGRDLTDVIGQSPHGRSKLQQLTVVGKLGP